MGQQEGDRAVQGHGFIQFVLEHVQVVQSVGVVHGGILSPGVGQGEGGCVFWDTVDVLGTRKGKVQSERRGALGLGV